jgi:hypothetical protein
VNHLLRGFHLTFTAEFGAIYLALSTMTAAVDHLLAGSSPNHKARSLSTTAAHNSTFCGTITGVSLTSWDRHSADSVDHPSPGDEPNKLMEDTLLAAGSKPWR